MSIISKLPTEVKDVAISEAQHILDDYIKSESKSKGGKYLRSFAKVVRIVLPFIKIVKINKKP